MSGALQWCASSPRRGGRPRTRPPPPLAASCATATDWRAGTWYPAGSIVRYNGSHYIAEHDNPGYDPVIPGTGLR